MEQTMTGGAPASTGFDRRWLALGVTTIGSFMSILDSTIVNIALPSILRGFHSSLQNGQLVLTVYLLSLAVVVPASGFLGDRFGMKRLYIITLILFTGGSALCGLAWNLQTLILFRVIQGLGGGMLQPLGMAIVFTMITPLERGRFMALLGLPMVLAPIIGPTVGGYLVEYSSWRTIFMINLPIGLINVVLAVVLLKETTMIKDAKLDLPGLVLAAIAFPCLLLGLSQGESSGWTSLLVLTLFGVGTVALIAFIRVELRNVAPLLEVRLFGNRMFSLAMVVNFVTQFSLFGLTFILPLFLQLAHGLSPVKTGLVLFPSGLCAFISMNLSGKGYNRIGPRPLAIAGLGVMMLATGLLSRITQNTSVVEISALASLRGLAMGFCMMPIQTLVYNTVPKDKISRAPALTNVLFRLFGSASTAVLTTILVVSLASHGAPSGATITNGQAPLGLLVKAFRDALWAMTAISALGVVLAFYLRDAVLERLWRGEIEPVVDEVEPDGIAVEV